jgi:hypothetical protein
MVNDLIEDFNGFTTEDINDVDFFTVEEDEVIDTTKKPLTSEEKSKIEEEEKVKDKEPDLFAVETKDDKDEDVVIIPPGTPAPVGDEVVLEGSSLTTLAMMKEKGYLDYTLEEGEELTDVRAGEILEDSMDNVFDTRVEKLFEEMPTVLKEMNKFVINGGDIDQFLNKVSLQNNTGLTEGMDMTVEENQIASVTVGLTEEGYDAEYISAQIDFLKDSKRLEAASNTHYTRWSEKKETERQAILTGTENKLKAEKTQRRELKGRVSSYLKDTESVAGFTLTPGDKIALPDYMSDRTVKLDNGSQVTSMQRDLLRVLNSPTGSVQMAKLLKAASQKGELNFEEIKIDTETKVTKKVIENVRRDKKQSIVKTAGAKKQLADYFN